MAELSHDDSRQLPRQQTPTKGKTARHGVLTQTPLSPPKALARAFKVSQTSSAVVWWAGYTNRCDPGTPVMSSASWPVNNWIRSLTGAALLAVRCKRSNRASASGTCLTLTVECSRCRINMETKKQIALDSPMSHCLRVLWSFVHLDPAYWRSKNTQWQA